MNSSQTAMILAAFGGYYFPHVVRQQDPRKCTECQKPIPPGRAGRKCKECREQ